MDMSKSKLVEREEHVMGELKEKKKEEDEGSDENPVSSHTVSILQKCRLEYLKKFGKIIFTELAKDKDFMATSELKEEEKQKLLLNYVSWDDPKREWPINMKKKPYRRLFNQERSILCYRNLVRKMIPCLEIGLCLKFSCGLTVPFCPNPQSFGDEKVKDMSLKTFLKDLSMKEYRIKLTRKPAETWEDAQVIIDKFVQRKSEKNSLIMILLSDDFVSKNSLLEDWQEVKNFVGKINVKDLDVVLVMKGTEAIVVDSTSTTV